jgi:hypothetical protein
VSSVVGPSGPGEFIQIGGGTDALLTFVVVPPGNYFITAKVSLFNFDNDNQSAHCSLSTGDVSEVFMTGGGGLSGPEYVITLLDSASFNANESINLTCNTFNGAVHDIKLAALQVGGIN